MTIASHTPEEPAEFAALVALAQREHRAGRLAEAAATYRRIVRLNPDVAEVHNHLGNVLKEQGELDQAAAQFQHALALNPTFFAALMNLAGIFHDQGELEQAAARYTQAIALRPGGAIAYGNLGNVLVKLGRRDEAVARCEQAVALRPDLFQVHVTLGCIYQEQGQLDQAAASFKRAIALRPDLAAGHNTLGNVLSDQGKADEAKAAFERAIALQPDLFQAHNSLGIILQEQGDVDQALVCYRRALAINPHFAAAHNCLAHGLRNVGQLEEAAAHYEQALALNPDFSEVHYNRATLKTFRAGDADLAALESLAADAGRLAPAKMLQIHFALGKALEDVGDYRRGFQHLLQGNALKRQEVDYDAWACHTNFQLVAEQFDACLSKRLGQLGDPSQVPIFIVGMPRSGSTLLEQILASHPQVQAAGELKNLERTIRSVCDSADRPMSFPHCVTALDADVLRRMGHDYLASLPRLADGKIRITDKMPGNFLHVGLIRLMLPNARIIHAMRDPVDTCVSCFAKLFRTGHTFSYNLAELGDYYRGYFELMAHWRSVLPAGAMLDVVYEDVVNNLEDQARRLIDYCGLPWDDRCLNFHQHSRSIATASNFQVRQPIYRSSVARWRRYEAFLEPLLAELEIFRVV